MDSDVFVDFLLDNGLYKTAQELIIELEAAGEPVPAKLIGFFGRADSNSVKSNESGIKEDAGHRLSSEQLALYDVLSQIAPESKGGPEEESKALLRYKLKLANEEIERLKAAPSEPRTCDSFNTVLNPMNEKVAPVDNLDQLVMKYLEDRGLEYSASTLCDEANLDPSLDPQPTLIELVNSASSEDSGPSSILLEKKLKEKTIELEKAKSDLRAAHVEIERFSQSLVDNMLTMDTPVLATPTMPTLSGSMKGSVVQVSEGIWKMIQENAKIVDNEDNKDTFIANDMPNLLGIIEDCIEPLLSGILLKHRPLLIPLLLSAAYLSSSPESNDVFLKKLFNLIKKPDEGQREIIARGCAAYAKFCGDTRCEAELFPQLWLQLDHKHPERRLLVAETAAALALETGPKSHPLLMSICQQLLEDKDSEVSVAAANSFAVLLSYSDDVDKLSSIQNSSIKIINDDSIPMETALLVLSIISKVSFEAEKESNLVHKLLKIVETEQDSKRALRAVAEILPHFYAALVIDSSCSYSTTSQSKECFYVSKFNAISNAYPEAAELPADNNWKTASNQEHSRFNVILTLLTKQMVPRLVDCALECPVMPDFCEIWTEIFATLAQLFGPSFIKTYVNPLMISELGLFTDSTEKTALQTILVSCFCSGCIATLIDDKYMFEYFSMVLREILFKITPLYMNGFEITIESLLQREGKSDIVAKRVNEATLGVLWEGVTNENEDIRKITARAITCAARKLSLTDISRQLFPALNSICLDSSHTIRKEASNCVAVVIQRTQVERHDDLEKRLQKIVMQLMVDQFSDVKTSIIKTLVPIALDSDQTYREDFFLPQVAMVVTNITPASVDTSLVETILDLYDQLLSSNTMLSNGCLTANVIPALESLEPICKTKVFHRIIQLQSLIRTSISRVEPKQGSPPLTTSKSAYSLSSVLRNPFSKKQ